MILRGEQYIQGIQLGVGDEIIDETKYYRCVADKWKIEPSKTTESRDEFQAFAGINAAEVSSFPLFFHYRNRQCILVGSCGCRKHDGISEFL